MAWHQGLCNLQVYDEEGELIETTHARRTKAVGTAESCHPPGTVSVFCQCCAASLSCTVCCHEVCCMLQVRFTCKLCGTTMTKAVNPHAWEQGSVFARCDGPKCKVIHNLVDNLRIIKYLRL